MKQTIIVLIYFLLFNSENILAQETAFFAMASIPATEIKNCKNTEQGRVYATISFIESEVMRKCNLKLDLSELFVINYLYKTIVDSSLSQNKDFNFSKNHYVQDVLKIISEYGIIPEENFKGSNDRGIYKKAEMFNKMKNLIDSSNEMSNKDTILYNYLGKAPDKFKNKKRNYTAQNFTKKVLAFNPDDYFELTSNMNHRQRKFIELETDGINLHKYYNFNINGIVTAVNISLFNGYSVVWSGDTSNIGYKSDDYFDNELAVLCWDDEKALKTKSMSEYRLKNINEKNVTNDHSLHIIGMAYDIYFEKIYYMAKDSAGKGGKTGGYIYLSEDYIKLNTISILFHKEALKKTHYLNESVFR